MRAALTVVYKGSGLLAGFFLVAIAALSLTQIIGRLLGFAAHSYDEIAGYCMAASSFMGLAWTLRCNQHIRVTLMIGRFKGARRRAFELFCLALAAALTAYFSWSTISMVWTSYVIDDVSQGLVPIKLWIPQSAMALGLSVLLLAFLDDLVIAWWGAPPSYDVPDPGMRPADPPAFER